MKNLKNSKVLQHTHTRFRVLAKNLLGLAVILLAFLISSCSSEIDNSPMSSQDEAVFDELKSGSNRDGTQTQSSIFDECGELVSAGCSPPSQDTRNFQNILQYPGCTFTIQWDQSDCINLNQQTDYYIGNIKLISHNCPQFEIDLANATNAGDAALRAFLINFDLIMTKAIEDWILFNTPNWQTVYNCNDPNLHTLSITRLQALCFTYCLSQGSKSETVYRRLRCGEGCCNRSVKKCYNPATDQIETTVSVSQISNPNLVCDVLPDPVPRGCIYLIPDCDVSCE
ncbi:MAG TPA: hypothetical protein PK147_08085 [Saprospiraceae bacterium]|nr:hypothetical protein [Lewinellaceae bacterium]HPQ21795.1 hypothetical protein [Saprospiraceae bacterium]